MLISVQSVLMSVQSVLISVQSVLIFRTNTEDSIKYLLKIRYTVVTHRYTNRRTVEHSYVFRQYLLLLKACNLLQLFISSNGIMYLVSYSKR